MRWLLVVLVASLAGCVINDQVRVSAVNETDTAQTVRVTVTWSPSQGDAVERLNRSMELEPGQTQHVGSFLRPCEDRLVGELRYVAEASNGTHAVLVQAWDGDGCVEQGIWVDLAADRMEWHAAYGD